MKPLHRLMVETANLGVHTIDGHASILTVNGARLALGLEDFKILYQFFAPWFQRIRFVQLQGLSEASKSLTAASHRTILPLPPAYHDDPTSPIGPSTSFIIADKSTVNHSYLDRHHHLCTVDIRVVFCLSHSIRSWLSPSHINHHPSILSVINTTCQCANQYSPMLSHKFNIF